MLNRPDIMKYITFKGLQRAGHIVRMDNSRILKNVRSGKYNEGRRVVRLRLGWEDNIVRESSLLLKIRKWVRLAGDRDTLRRTAEEARARCGLSRHSRRRSKKGREQISSTYRYS